MSDQGDPTLTKPIKIPNQDSQKERGDTLLREQDPVYSEIPEWQQEFRENLVDEEIPEHGDSHASSSHKASLKPIFMRREDLNYNCPVQETQWRSRTSCRKFLVT